MQMSCRSVARAEDIALAVEKQLDALQVDHCMTVWVSEAPMKQSVLPFEDGSFVHLAAETQHGKTWHLS